MKKKTGRLAVNRLSLVNLRVSVAGKKILKGISFTVRGGEIHVVMGPNGSGKSTLALALMGHPAYALTRPSRGGKPGAILLNSRDINGLTSDKRAKAGLFLSLQSPVAIPGVSVFNLLRAAVGARGSAVKPGPADKVQNPLLARRWQAAGMTLAEFSSKVKQTATRLRVEAGLLNRGINDGFSGGEKKKIEMLQALLLRPKFAVFDEIDTGLDVDALFAVAAGITALQKTGTGVIVITHYPRILRYLHPDAVHVLVGGRIVQTGTAALAHEIEQKGYTGYVRTAAGH